MPVVTRRTVLAGAAGALLARPVEAPAMPERRPPNVVLIVTDDQAYGDLGLHGNRHLRTPWLDRLGTEGVRLDRFYVSPVCAPTRASLMTGRWNYRTCAIDTWLGRAMLHPEEVTLAEMLRSAGYRTGLFGKWHLGDNFPMRPIDRGFEEALHHNGGGMCQPADPPDGSYFDPLLRRNGRWVRERGYCTDVFGRHAVRFIERNRNRPFFLYLATNAPHSPLQAPEELVASYRSMGLGENTARVYAMVENIDDNVGRVLACLDALRLAENTIVVYLSDNGPCPSQRDPGQPTRYNAGLRDEKGTVYDGGIRVPCFLRWPAGWPGGRRVDRVAAHVDLAPTILEACGVAAPDQVAFDGRSLHPLLARDGAPWADRDLFFQWHRGDEPVAWRNCAVVNQRWKLVEGRELYDLQADPSESRDAAAENPAEVARMREAYERWFRDVSATRGYAPPRIVLGSPRENPSTLTRQDWRGPRAGWEPDALGHWEVRIEAAGDYRVRLRFAPVQEGCAAELRVGGVVARRALRSGAASCTFDRVRLPEGEARLEAWVEQHGQTVGVHYADVQRL